MHQTIHQFERQGVVVLQLFGGHLQRVAGEMRQVAIKPRTAVDAKVQLAVTTGEGVRRSDTIPRVGMLLGSLQPLMLSGQLLPDGLVLRAGHQSLPIEETTFGATSDIHNSVKPHFSEVGGGEDLTERPYVGWFG